MDIVADTGIRHVTDLCNKVIVERAEEFEFVG